MRLTHRELLRLALLAFTLCLATLPESVEAREPTLYSQVETLSELSRLVKRHYFEETDPIELYDGAISGYLSHLDPHSTYVSPAEVQETQERLQGAFEGIGIFFDVVDGFLTVLSPIEGSPASHVGLLPGDRIVKIDGRSAVDIKVPEVTSRLKGRKGSLVRVSVQREGLADILEFRIIRDKINVPSVPTACLVGAGIGYVRISRFSERTGKELERALEQLRREGIRKLLLDLRSNGGGYLEQGVAVANQFLERDRLLVYTEGRHPNSREEHYAERDPLVPPSLPLLVLVNSFSASASEIVAGAIQDYDRGLVVGHTTFGKGLVQKQYPLQNGGAVLLTVARYFTPSGRPIQRPFSDDRLSYVEAGHDDFDPNANPDPALSRPIYYTRILHRKVFGSGGITPDVMLATGELTEEESRLAEIRPSPFLEFAVQHATRITSRFPSFQSFAESYTPGRAEMAALAGLLRERGEEISDEVFASAGDYIRREIRRQVAQIRWGNRAEGQIRARYDAQVGEALALFGEAEALLANRLNQVGVGRTGYRNPGSVEQVR